jgi:PAS domain S-box-containing protein
MNKLHQSEAHFRMMADAVPVMIWMSGTDKRYTFFNKGWLKFTGRTIDQELNYGWLEGVHPDDRQHRLESYTTAFEARQEFEVEYRLRRHDGNYRWVLDRAALQFSPDNSFAGYVGSCVDITQYKQAELNQELLIKAEQALRMSEERLRLATEIGGIGIWDMDLLTQTRNWSDQGKAIYGLAPHEMLDFARQLSLIHPDDREMVNSAVVQFRDYGTIDKLELQHRILRPDGQLRWVAVRGEATHIGEGAERRPARLIGTIIDITERKRTEEALRQSEAQLRALAETLEQRVAERTAELERRNQELDQFAYIASHDLKAPLRAIDNLATWISDDAGNLLPVTSQQHLELLRSRVKRMEDLLNGLLAYSRADRYHGEAELVDTHSLVKDVIELVAPPESFTITIQEKMPVMNTLRSPLETVLRNLIGNAIKHHHRSDGRVHISAEERDGLIEFTVKDDGPGIPEIFHERVFMIFQTLRPRDQVEGSGMGLAIVKKTVESCGGKISLISSEGQGAAFCFTWPKD